MILLSCAVFFLSLSTAFATLANHASYYYSKLESMPTTFSHCAQPVAFFIYHHENYTNLVAFLRALYSEEGDEILRGIALAMWPAKVAGVVVSAVPYDEGVGLKVTYRDKSLVIGVNRSMQLYIQGVDGDNIIHIGHCLQTEACERWLNLTKIMRWSVTSLISTTFKDNGPIVARALNYALIGQNTCQVLLEIPKDVSGACRETAIHITYKDVFLVVKRAQSGYPIVLSIHDRQSDAIYSIY